MNTDLDITPLDALHRTLSAKMVPFAGYAMPLHYPLGVLKEHLHCRAAAGLFDVSHMGQAYLHGTGGSDPAAALETLCPSALASLKPGQMRYTVLLDEAGGLIDDLIVTRTHDAEGTLYLVVNAASKAADYARIEQALAGRAALEPLDDRALIALQGPKAAEILARLAPESADLYFMEATNITLEGVVCWVSRSGYTGEDGFEISVPAAAAAPLAERLLRVPEVEAIGLGARDSLRLEAGLCLSGDDFDTTRSPVEAGLLFTLAKARRVAGAYAGSARILAELETPPAQRLVGIQLEGRAPARRGSEIQTIEGEPIGIVTSGGFGPSVGGPIALGYVAHGHAAPGTPLMLMVRGKPLAARVSPPPFIAQHYVRRPRV